MAVCLGDSQALAALKLPLRLLTLGERKSLYPFEQIPQDFSQKIHEGLNKSKNPPKFPFTLASHFPALG
jgi:hypothetical protein